MNYPTTLDGLLSTLTRLHRHGSPPVLGSTEWAELAPSSPLRVAAIYRAALMWAFEHDLDDDIDDRLKAASLDVADARDWPAEARFIRHRADALKSGAYIERRTA